MDERRSMTKLSRFASIGCIAVACSSSSDPPPPATGDGGSGEIVCVTIHDEDKLPWDLGAPLPKYFCDANKSTKYPDGPNACRNTSDCTIIDSGQVREITRVCGLSCRKPDAKCDELAACGTDCVVSVTNMKVMDPGLSPACAGCYTDVALCSLAYCLSNCAASADAPECVKCQFESGCRIPFERCSGLDRN
jgi:hypothetical protein